MNTTNRLQFRYHDQVFETRDAAIDYIKSMIRFAEDGLAKDDPSYGYSLLAEPTVLLYQKEGDSGNTDPHLIIAIGSVTNEGGQYSDNKFCIIDIDKTEQEIADLAEELEKAIKSLTIIAQDSDTLKLYANKTDEGTFVSGDVKVAEAHIFDNLRKENNLMVTEDGLFIYVNLEYDEERETFTFTVSKSDGTLDKTTVKFPNNYLVSGYYDKTDESLHLEMKEGNEVIIDCENLIAEWGVEGEGSKTPIILTKEEIDYDGTEEHHHVEPWQDVLRADIRIKDEEKDPITGKYVKDPNSTNILSRTSDGRYLYVDGKASNIIYYKNGEKTTVKKALDDLSNVKLSTDSENIITERTDGFFASTKLEYKSNENKLIFKVSSQNGEKKTEIALNSVELFEHIYYDATKEALIITYKDNKGETQFVEIPIGEMIRDWEWEPQNEGHNVKIVKKRNVSGNDKVSADANIFQGQNNILVDLNHSLYVRGEADNIVYGENSNVKKEIDNLKVIDSALDNKINIEIERAQNTEAALDAKIDQEIADREAADTVLDNKIGTGFTDDPHENVTYKFEQLQNQVNEEADKLQDEIDRSTAKDDEHDGKIQAIEDEIGDGFEPRNTVRDEIDNLQAEIEAVSANTEGKLKDIINNDNSIDIDKTNPTEPVVKVNLSTEVEDDRYNIIKLNSDGLFANVDLSYEQTANKLIFHTSNGQPDKEIQLESMSSIISIEYNPSKEAIVITYMTNGHEVKTVEIPVGDLINEWRIWDGHEGAVQLEKIRIASGTSEQDILKATVVISETHDDNIIVNDNGALYVSGKGIIDNATAIEALNERVDSIDGEIDTLGTNLNNEISRATNAEADERRRAEAAEHDLQNLISLEATTRESGDTMLSHLIEDETEKRISGDTLLQNTITEVEAALNNEINRASAKEAELTTSVNENANNIIAEENRAKAAEQALDNKISNETNRAQYQEEYLLQEIYTEREKRISGDTLLQDAIDGEESRAREKENDLQISIANEVSRAQTSETELRNAITAETLRAQEADNELYQKIADETSSRSTSDAALDSKIEQEISRAQVAENSISERLNSEITRSTNEDQTLRGLINTEIANRENGDAELEEAIRNATLTFDDTSSINFTKTTGNVVTADVKLQGGENIIKIGEGLYATVNLSYDAARNTIKLVTSNGEQEAIQLNTVGSLIDGIEYDATNRALVIKYHDAAGNPLQTSFPVNQLFNDWVVDNPSEKSAVELTKMSPIEPDDPDKLSARILITDDHDGDGKPDEGSDNIIEIRNNGLYVNGSSFSAATASSECIKSELTAVEKAIFGNQTIGECGEGFVYEAPEGTIYINTARTVNNATYILDSNLNRLSSFTENVDNKVDTISGNVECLKSELNITQENVLGMNVPECGLKNDGTPFTYIPNEGTYYIYSGTSFNHTDIILDRELKKTNDNVDILNQKVDIISGDVVCTASEVDALGKLAFGSSYTIPQCGEGAAYPTAVNGCIISAATSLHEADMLLDQAFCSMMNDWFLVGWDTPSNHTTVEKIGQNRHMVVDSRLSHGNHNGMSDEELVITSNEGVYIDPTRTEFTDTNVIRVVNITDGPDHTVLPADNPYNGIYLSNVWDCGLYYSETEDAEAIAEANAAGYNTIDYRTDESSTASNYNYMNNVRQTDI